MFLHEFPPIYAKTFCFFNNYYELCSRLTDYENAGQPNRNLLPSVFVLKKNL